MLALGVEVEVGLELLDSPDGSALIQSWVRRCLEEAVASLEAGFLDHGSLGVARIVVLEVA